MPLVFLPLLSFGFYLESPEFRVDSKFVTNGSIIYKCSASSFVPKGSGKMAFLYRYCYDAVALDILKDVDYKKYGIDDVFITYAKSLIRLNIASNTVSKLVDRDYNTVNVFLYVNTSSLKDFFVSAANSRNKFVVDKNTLSTTSLIDSDNPVTTDVKDFIFLLNFNDKSLEKINKKDLEIIKNEWDRYEFKNASRVLSIASNYLKSNVSEIYNILGIAYADLGNYRSALEVLKEYSLKFGYNANLLNNLAVVYALSYDFSAVLNYLNNAIKIGDKNINVYYFNRASLFFSGRSIYMAKADMDKLSALSLLNSRMYFLKSRINYELGNLDTALKYVKAAIMLEDTDERFYVYRSKLFYDMKFYDDSLRDLSYAIFLNNNSYDALFHRANLYLNLRYYDLAIGDFNRLLTMRKGVASVYSALSLSYYKMANIRQSCISAADAVFFGETYMFTRLSSLGYCKNGSDYE